MQGTGGSIPGGELRPHIPWVDPKVKILKKVKHPAGAPRQASVAFLQLADKAENHSPRPRGFIPTTEKNSEGNSAILSPTPPQTNPIAISVDGFRILFRSFAGDS